MVQAVNISPGDMSRIARAVRYVEGIQAERLTAARIPQWAADSMPVLNGSGAEIPAYGIVWLQDKSAPGGDEYIAVAERPTCPGIQSIGIATSIIPDGEYGRVWTHGLRRVLMDEDHYTALAVGDRVSTYWDSWGGCVAPMGAMIAVGKLDSPYALVEIRADRGNAWHLTGQGESTFDGPAQTIWLSNNLEASAEGGGVCHIFREGEVVGDVNYVGTHGPVMVACNNGTEVVGVFSILGFSDDDFTVSDDGDGTITIGLPV